VAFSPDGKLLASGGYGPITVWDVTARAADPTPAEPLTAEEKDRLWQALAETDAARAYAAMGKLQEQLRPAVALLAERLPPAPDLPEQRIRDLIGELDADAFVARERASAELASAADVARGPMQAALARGMSAEVKRRLEQILDGMDGATPNRLRQTRAVEVLERLGTPQAIDLLRKLAAGAADARLTREAKETLQRQGRGPQP
jgi:hypothetical protein